MDRDGRFMNLAYKVAKQSCHKFPMGAVIVKGNRVLSLGTNKYKTNPRQINFYDNRALCSTHAELNAIILCNGEKEGATIYICRLLSNGKFGIAKPCKGCQHIIEASNIKRIVYSDYDGVKSYQI